MNLSSLQPCKGAKKCVLVSVWQMQWRSKMLRDLLSSSWCWISVRAETEPLGCVFGARDGLCHRTGVWNKYLENFMKIVMFVPSHRTCTWGGSKKTMCLGCVGESCWLLGLSHLHVTLCKISLPSCMLRTSLRCQRHLCLLACLNFYKSSSLGGLGLHAGITNTRVLQFLLCFAGTAFLETFSKTLNWIFTS